MSGLYEGWTRRPGDSKQEYTYFPEATDNSQSFTLYIDMRVRKVWMYPEPESTDGERIQLPRTIRNEQEAMAWAVAMWRMS